MGNPVITMKTHPSIAVVVFAVLGMRVLLAAGEPPAPAPAPPPLPSGATEVGGSKGRLRGEVSFSRQEPVAGAVLVLIRQGDAGTLFTGTTDRDGFFRFESVPEGSWTIGIVREGAASLLKEGVQIKPPARAMVDFVLKKQTGRITPPIFDLARFEGGAGEPAKMVTEDTHFALTVLDPEMKPVHEARIVLRSRGPRVDPLRGVTDGKGQLQLPKPEPGEYQLKIEMPGFLPIRIDRLVLGRTAPTVTAVLTPRPFDFPASPADLIPEEKPVPPDGFPGSTEKKPSGFAG